MSISFFVKLKVKINFYIKNVNMCECIGFKKDVLYSFTIYENDVITCEELNCITRNDWDDCDQFKMDSLFFKRINANKLVKMKKEKLQEIEKIKYPKFTAYFEIEFLNKKFIHYLEDKVEDHIFEEFNLCNLFWFVENLSKCDLRVKKSSNDKHYEFFFYEN